MSWSSRLCAVAAGAIAASALVVSAGGARRPEAPEAAAGTASCPLTRYTDSTYPRERTGFPTAHWFGGDGIWAGQAPDYRGGWFATEMKVLWYRAVSGRLTVTGRRLDGDGPPLEAHVPDGYGSTGIQASGLAFPEPGCWEVRARVGAHTLRFVVSVRPACDVPDAGVRRCSPGAHPSSAATRRYLGPLPRAVVFPSFRVTAAAAELPRRCAPPTVARRVVAAVRAFDTGQARAFARAFAPSGRFQPYDGSPFSVRGGLAGRAAIESYARRRHAEGDWWTGTRLEAPREDVSATGQVVYGLSLMAEVGYRSYVPRGAKLVVDCRSGRLAIWLGPALAG